MIYIHRDWSQVPDDVKQALQTAAAELDAIAEPAQRKAYIQANQEKWAALRDHLAAMSSGKCWYSEAREAVSRYQVDHFRPHGRAKQAPKTYDAGYSWLAFDLDNLRLAGMLCNIVNMEFSEDAVGKGDWFPLYDPSRRASLQSRNTAPETPVLLDPADPDDPRKLRFNEDGNVVPDPDLPDDEQRRVEQAIACLGLRQSRLNGRRRTVLLRALRAIHRLKAVDRVAKGDRTPRDKDTLNEARAELLAMSARAGEFAAAVRCLLINHKLKELAAGDELKPLALAAESV